MNQLSLTLGPLDDGPAAAPSTGPEPARRRTRRPAEEIEAEKRDREIRRQRREAKRAAREARREARERRAALRAEAAAYRAARPGPDTFQQRPDFSCRFCGDPAEYLPADPETGNAVPVCRRCLNDYADAPAIIAYRARQINLNQEA